MTGTRPEQTDAARDRAWQFTDPEASATVDRLNRGERACEAAPWRYVAEPFRAAIVVACYDDRGEFVGYI